MKKPGRNIFQLQSGSAFDLPLPTVSTIAYNSIASDAQSHDE
jgi:hypothetical protein